MRNTNSITKESGNFMNETTVPEVDSENRPIVEFVGKEFEKFTNEMVAIAKAQGYELAFDSGIEIYIRRLGTQPGKSSN